MPNTATVTHPLKLERKRRNLSQKMLADFTGLGLSTIVRAERGEQVGAEARRRISEYLSKSSEELGLLPVVASGRYVEVNHSASLLADDGEEDDMNRRQALRTFGLAGTALLFGSHQLLSEEPWERLSRALSKPSLIDDSTINHLQTITHSYWQLRANTASRELLGGVVGHLQTVTEMLHNSRAMSNQQNLCSIAGEVALIAGQMTFDVNDYASARAYYKASMEAASEGQNASLYAVALARTSFTYIDSGDSQSALAFLERANGIGQLGNNTIVRSWVKAIEAEAYANTGNLASCQQAIEAAEELSSQTQGETDQYWTGFNASRLAGYKGVCYVRLHRPDEALGALSQSLMLMNSSSTRRQPRILTDMAMAHVQKGEIEEACHLATTALTITRQTHNVIVVPRLQRLRKTLEPWRTTPSVMRLDEQLLLA